MTISQFTLFLFEPVFQIIPFIVFGGFILVFGIILFRGIQSLSQWHSNNKAEVIEVNATVKDKRDEIRIYGGHETRARSSTNYYVTFELSNLERVQLKVKSSDYGLLSIGDEGRLNYQGTRFNSFERNRVVDDRFSY